MTKKVLTIGSAMHDLFLEYEQKQIIQVRGTDGDTSYIALEEGKKIEVHDLVHHIGGGALNSAVSFSRLGMQATICAKIGDDQNGIFIRETAQQRGVQTRYLAMSNSVQTGTSFIMPCPSGNRAVLVYRGANLTLTADDIPHELIKEADQIYITSLSGQTSALLPIITRIAKEHNKSVATNPGTSQLTSSTDTLFDALKNIDIVILNKHEAMLFFARLNNIAPEMLTQPSKITNDKQSSLFDDTDKNAGPSCFSLQKFFTLMHNHGPRIVAVTNGAEGVYVSNGSTIYFQPSIPTKIMSTLGAGDAFGSTFVGFLTRGASIKEALVAGAYNAASVLEHIDTQTGLLSLDALMAKIAQHSDNMVIKKLL